MKKAILLIALFGLVIAAHAKTLPPLRIFIRAGEKTHGPGRHDHPRFLKEWTALLNERGARATGSLQFPSAAELAKTDVLILFAADAGDLSAPDRANLEAFQKRGGGIVVLHDGITGHDPDWFKQVVGGAWRYGQAKYYEGEISLYYLDHQNPILCGASNFDLDDEEYYGLDLLPEAKVLAGAYEPDERNKHDGRIMPSVYNVAPQMWTYETNAHRAFVALPGHNYKTFGLPQYRAVLLRGIAWAGKREVDSLASPAELASLLYPENGPTAPKDAAKKIVLPPDFNLRLVASEPLIEKPISLDWDAQGRLWIAETPEYPFRQDRSRPPYDRISIQEDSKHDGHMDKKTIFYDGLDLVTSMVFYKDGVIVSQAPYIIWLRDTHGQGHADVRQILYKGFGTNDTHAVVNNLRWGLDGWIYATIGYTRGDIYSGDGQKHFGLISDGVIRFRPDGSAIEQVSSKSSNTWGVDVAPDGEIFYTQANGNHIDHVVMPETALARGRVGATTSYAAIEDHHRSFPLMTSSNQAYVQIDWVGNFTAAAGCCIYDGGAWPEKYNYTHYVSEPTINIVHQDILTPKGVSYVASKDPARLDKEFIASTDLWFRPIHQRVGPDGALYILDFYNQAAVHNDTRGPRHDPKSNSAIRPDRDHYFGRIWRVQYDEARKFKIPHLAHATTAQLVKALEHPNEWVRGTALRLLLERDDTNSAPSLEKLARSETAPAYTRIHALWALSNLGGDMVRADLPAAINSNEPEIRKTALEIAALLAGQSGENLFPSIIAHADDANARVRLEALLALQNYRLPPAAVQTLLTNYPGLADGWSQSAFVGLASRQPLEFISAAMDAQNSADYGSLIIALTSQIAEQGEPGASAQLVILLSQKPASALPLKLKAMENLNRALKPDVIAPWTPPLSRALQDLLASTNADLVMLSLPLAARWDTQGNLAAPIKTLVKNLFQKLNDPSEPDAERAQLARSLLAVRKIDPQMVAAVGQILGSSSSTELQHRIISALGSLPDADIGDLLIAAYPKLPPELETVALNELFKRSDWSLALVSAIEARKIDLTTLSPVSINRLRTHSNPEVAALANKVIDAIRGPETQEKDALIAKFTPLVVQPGDPVNGKKMFLQNCAVCHRFNGQGKEVAPDLTGMGAHGPASLIIHVLDPNREVEPNYYAYSIETKDGEIYDGVIARENKSSITLRNAAGDIDISLKDIKSRRNTGRSLMPNGFESLGAETLRDILAYLCAGTANYRILDLKPVFDASSSKGMWFNEENAQEGSGFEKFGVVKVDDVPFEIVNPLKVPTGKNVIVLKGGMGYAKTQPKKVELSGLDIKADRLHFLGGIAGWGFPWGGADGHKDLPVAKVTVHFADQPDAEFVLKNGVEFADWIGADSVPGSASVPDLAKRGQVRWFTKVFPHPGEIKSVTLESYDNEVAPAFIAITAENGGGKAAPGPQAPVAPKELKWTPGFRRVLIVGGGSSHDFNRWFNQADSATLSALDKTSVNYTENLDQALLSLKEADVLYLNSNQPMTNAALRQAIFDFANAGHGILLVHPALWYNWDNWPEYNRTLVGGGTHSHDKYGEFQVTVKEPSHPVMAKVPLTFKITDELYHSEIDPKGTPIEVLAEAKNDARDKIYPSVWIVKHPHARIVCIALGHDAQAHELAAYKTILQNSLNWVSGTK